MDQYLLKELELHLERCQLVHHLSEENRTIIRIRQKQSIQQLKNLQIKLDHQHLNLLL